MFVTSLFEIIKCLCRENWLIVSFGVASSQPSVIASSAWAPVPQAADENPRAERKIPRKTARGKKKRQEGPCVRVRDGSFHPILEVFSNSAALNTRGPVKS